MGAGSLGDDSRPPYPHRAGKSVRVCDRGRWLEHIGREPCRRPPRL